MVSSGCIVATAFYTLPILSCSFYSILCILNLKLSLLRRLGPFLPFQIDAKGATLATPKEAKDGKDAKAVEASDSAPAAGESSHSPQSSPGLAWPVWSIDFAKPSIGLFLWCLFPIMAYGVIRGLSDCEQFELICWKVEDQTTSSHARNLLHLLTISILSAWLCRVPTRRRDGAVFAAVAVCEFLINKFFWQNCEEFLAHSVSSGSTFGVFDVFIAVSTLVSLLMLICDGLPCLRRLIQTVTKTAAAGEQNLHLLSRSGQRNYLLYWGFIVFFHAVLIMAFPNDLHLHHYWGGIVMATFCIFQTPLSRLLLLKGVMMAIDGIGVWGADSIVGEDDGGITEGDADLRLMLCILVVLAFMLALGLNVYRDPRIRALTGLAHAKNPALDTE